MRYLLFVSTALLCTVTLANAATLFSGDGELIDRNGIGDILGAGLDDGRSGSVTVNGGTSLTLLPGTSPDILESRPKIDLGDGVGASGSMTITGTGTEVRIIGSDTGAKAEIGGDSDAGGTGVLNVSNGARLLLQETDATGAGNLKSAQIALGDGGTGSMTVDDATVDLVGTNATYIGVAIVRTGSVGTFNVTNGSTLSMEANGIAADGSNDAVIEIAGGDDTIGSMTVAGSNVMMSAPNNFVGLTVAGNGAISGIFRLDDSMMTMTGVDAELDVGRGGFGTAALENGSTLTMDTTNSAGLRIGRDEGDGIVSILDASELAIDSDSFSRIAVGSEPGTIGTLAIRDGSSVRLMGPKAIMDIGDPSPDGSGASSGTVIVAGTDTLGTGSLLSTETDILVGADSGAGTTSGTLVVADGGRVVTPSLTVNSGGILTGADGVVAGEVNVLNGGVIAPGSSPGTMTIEGDLNIGAGANLFFELASATLFDVLNVTGNVFVDDTPFNATFSFLGGFVPEDGALFEVITSGVDLPADLFANAQITLLGAGPGSEFGIEQSGGGLTFVATDIAAVPAPGGLAMLLSGLAVFAAAGRGIQRTHVN